MGMGVSFRFDVGRFREAYERYSVGYEPFAGLEAGKNLYAVAVVAPRGYRAFQVRAGMRFDVNEQLSLLFAEGRYGNCQRVPFPRSAEIHLAERPADNGAVAVEIKVQGDVSG